MRNLASATGAPKNPLRLGLFRNLAKAGDPSAPYRAPWSRVYDIGTVERDVLWAGWAAANEVFVVGDEGRILRFDGSIDCDGNLWQPMTSATRLPLHAIWGRNRNELHAVGWMGTVISFDGEQWYHRRGGVIDQQTECFVPDVENTPLFAITGDEYGRAWAVGDDGIILAFDGHTWQQQTSPTQANLRGITRTEGGQLFAVGAGGAVITSAGEGQWEVLDCPYGADFQSVLALSNDELLMGGGRYLVEAGGFRGALVRWRNGDFIAVEIEQAMPRLRSLKAYKDGVLIASDLGNLFYLKGSRLDRLRTDSRRDLMNIVSLPAGGALAVGDFSTVITAAVDFDQAMAPSAEAEWDMMESNTQRNLWGLHNAPDGTLYACGDAGTVLRYCDNRDSRDDGWQAMPAVSELAVHCVWATGAGSLFASGQMGRIFCYDGHAWQLAHDLNLDITILAMWGSGPDSIYAVGDEGLILHWNGLKWQRMISGTTSALYNIWGFDDTHILAVGDFGLVLHWNGDNWSEFNVGSENFLFDIWGDALDNIFIVGMSGTLAHFDGKRWNQTPRRARDDLMAVDGIPGHAPYAVGTQGNILHFDGDQWQPEVSPTTAGLRTVCARPDGTVFAAGNQGTILKKRLSSK